MELHQLVARGEQILESEKREKGARLFERAETLRHLLRTALPKEVWDALKMWPGEGKYVVTADCVILSGDVFSGQLGFTTTQQGIAVKYWRDRGDDEPMITLKLTYGDHDHKNVDTLSKALANIKRQLEQQG